MFFIDVSTTTATATATCICTCTCTATTTATATAHAIATATATATATPQLKSRYYPHGGRTLDTIAAPPPSASLLGPADGVSCGASGTVVCSHAVIIMISKIHILWRISGGLLGRHKSHRSIYKFAFLLFAEKT